MCRSYEYTLDAHKVKIFPSTPKGAALRWFMGLGSAIIQTWGDRKITFLEKY